ncbi:hypothetical protein [Acinetobacter proteolyticus]|uniref:Uncharacterized protein n=1 Tax=Acinetobacter proteolyticus TaxID=1776741 RepID=A0A2N0WII1_9GAMM|nr:hypothetical protein [Acinetobacter proteolyticus]PKF35571.1 hypothetical protein CW311_04590 [Acinetobacter proteolyticus]
MLKAISSYYRLKNGYAEDNLTALLSFSTKAGAADPVSSIELDGVSSNGREYRISADITNLQVATLAMCLYVEKGRVVTDTLDMFDALAAIHGDIDLNPLDDLKEGLWVTI